MSETLKKISINLNYSYLVIAKPTMLNNEFFNKTNQRISIFY